MKFAFVCLSVVLFVTRTFCEDGEQNDVPNESEYTDANTSPGLRKASEKRYLLDGRLLTLKAPRKKMHLKMASADVVCCK